MTTQILMAPPASGKTTAAVQAIRTLIAQRPTANAWVIVRDRLQANYFRGCLAAAGGAINVHVETFRDLYLEIIARSGLPLRPQLPAAMQYQIVQAAIDRAALSYFTPLRGSPGLTRSMQSLIAEMERALVTPEDLEAQAAPDRPGHAELARIYQSHLDLLDAMGWMDPDGLAGEALRALAACPRLLRDWDLLVVDGFDWFESAQIRTLQVLAGRAQCLFITLPGDAHRARAVQRHFAKNYAELSRVVHVQALPAHAPVHLPQALAALEAGLFETDASPYSGDADAVQLLEARSPQEEAREALRWIKARIARDHVPAERCAVLVHDPDVYFPGLRQAAVEFGLPVHFTQGRRLVDAPIIAAMLNLLRLPSGNFPRRALLDALRSPFFDFSSLGLERDQVDVLDLVSRQGKVIEGSDQWAEVFAALGQAADGLPGSDAPSVAVVSQDEAEGMPVPTPPRGAAAARLWAALQRVFDRLCPPPGTQNLRGWVAWMERVLDDLRFYEAGQARENREARPALLALRDGLQGLLTAETALDGQAARPVDYSGFLSTLQSVLEGLGVLEDSAASEPGIWAMRLLESRGLRFDSVAILGLAEGGFPRVERPDPLLDEAMRERLGMNPRLEQDQLGLFYQAVTRADGALLLTRPYLAESGDPWEASPFWNAVQGLFPKRVRRVRPEDIRPLSEAASLQEALFWAARQGMTEDPALPESYAALIAPYRQVLRAQSHLERQLGRERPPQAVDGALRQFVSERLSAAHTWSVTRLETYLSCPYRFFMMSFLGLEAHEPPDWDYDSAQMGSLLHEILEQVYQRAADPADPQAVLAVLPEVTQQAFAAAPTRYGFRPSRLWGQQCDELRERLADTITGLAEAGDGWRPLRFEQPFGLDGTPPLVLALDGGQVRLHGFIDRIDVNAAGELRVIDYKSGSRHLSAKDLVEGRRLQLAVYALAARDALGLGNPVEGF